MYWLYFVTKLSDYFKKRLGLTLKTSNWGGRDKDWMNLNYLLKGLHKRMEKSCGVLDMEHAKKYFFGIKLAFFGFVMHLGILRRKRGKWLLCHAQNFFWE